MTGDGHELRTIFDFGMAPGHGRKSQSGHVGEQEFPCEEDEPVQIARSRFSIQWPSVTRPRAEPRSSFSMGAIGAARKEGYAISQWATLRCRCGGRKGAVLRKLLTGPIGLVTLNENETNRASCGMLLGPKG